MASRNSGGSNAEAQRGAAREKVKAMQEAQRRKDRRTRALIVSAGVVIAAVLVTIAAIAITNVRQDDAAAAENLGEVVVPAGVSADGGIAVAGPSQAKAPVKVVEYLDYQCPACAQFDLAVGPYLKDQVAAGAVQVEYHPMNFLKQQSTTDYSLRSANAAYCLADDGAGDIAAFSDTLYAKQPPEGGSGLPDADLVAAATGAGASGAVEKCITSQTHGGYVNQQTDALTSAQDGEDEALVRATPTVFVDGTKVEDISLAGVQAAVKAAQS